MIKPLLFVVCLCLVWGMAGSTASAALLPFGVLGDERTSIVYVPDTGEFAVDAPASTELTYINIDSRASIFTGDACQSLGGSFGCGGFGGGQFR